MSLCDISHPTYVFKFIYTAEVSYRWLYIKQMAKKKQETLGEFRKYCVVSRFIFKYNIKHFISCKQKCKICSHKNILFITLHNSKWGCKYFLLRDIEKCINWQMCKQGTMIFIRTVTFKKRPIKLILRLFVPQFCATVSFSVLIRFIPL